METTTRDAGKTKGNAITPDIITAELLASLDKCPFCGADKWGGCKDLSRFDCGTQLNVGFRKSNFRERRCIEISETTLRARVKELEEAGDSLQKRLRIWSNLCGKRFVVGDEEAIANWMAVKKKGTK